MQGVVFFFFFQHKVSYKMLGCLHEQFLNEFKGKGDSYFEIPT